MTFRTRVWAVVAVGLACSVVEAAVTNGGFETGTLDEWSDAGSVMAVKEEYPRELLGLDQAPVDGVWHPASGDYFASLWSTDNNGVDVSLLSQTFEGTVGDVVQFDYFFDFGDLTPAYDMAVIVLTGPSGETTLVQINTAGYELADDQNVDWTHISWVLTETGSYALEFTVWDGPGVFESILGVDNVSVGAAIPAPGALVLGSIGAGVLGWLRRRRAA